MYLKKFLFLILILFRHSVFAETQTLILNSDTLNNYPNYFIKGWKYSSNDDQQMSQLTYDDSKWIKVESARFLNSENVDTIHVNGWYRFHFIADTSVVDRPLAMTMNHLGASEIYLDGKIIKKFGVIGNAATTINYEPQEIPFIFTIKDTGQHVIAVRYVNFNFIGNFKTHFENMAGFEIMMGESEIFIFHRDLKSILLSVFTLLIGFLFALCFLHLFMFLYYRVEYSNLYFSIFMLCLGLGCIIYFITYVTDKPSVELKAQYPVNALFCIGCVSLSGFISTLFQKGKTRLYIVSISAIIIMILRFLGLRIFGQLTLALIIGVSFEAVFTIIFGMIKRLKGVWIIGVGMLFFTLFIEFSF